MSRLLAGPRNPQTTLRVVLATTHEHQSGEKSSYCEVDSGNVLKSFFQAWRMISCSKAREGHPWKLNPFFGIELLLVSEGLEVSTQLHTRAYQFAA